MLKINPKKQMKKRICIIIIVFTICLKGIYAQSTYYVAINGNDSNTGTLNAPFKTIQYAFSKTNPGDIIYLRGGLYYERVIKIKGVGDRILTGLILSMGDYNLYSNASQITKLAGLNLVDKTSGSSINSPSHISHKGNHNLRYWAYHGALQVIKHPGPFQDLYNRKKAKSSYKGSGKRALIAVSDKLLRVVWAILKKGGDFNPEYNKK